MNIKGKKKELLTILIFLGLAFMFLQSVFPFYWMLVTSFKNKLQVYDASVWVFKPIFENYVKVFISKNFLKYLINSTVIAIFSVIISVFIGGLAAYGFARYQFKRKELYFFSLLALRMLPAIAFTIPYFIIGRFTGVLDTHVILIIASLTFNLPFTVWMMRGFFEEIPKELEESAKVDGCSTLQVLRLIVVPLAIPGITATGIFALIYSWNEFVYALILTSRDAVTIPILSTLFTSVAGTSYGQLATVGVLASTPILIFAMFVQKYMIRGLTFGAVKG